MGPATPRPRIDLRELGAIFAGGAIGGAIRTGLCGALTTFSAFQLDLLHMLDDGRVWLAALYAAGSIAAGLVGFVIGTNVVRQARFSW